MNPPTAPATSEAVLTLTRVFNAPRDIVFKAWTEAGIIKDVTRIDAFMNSPRRWHPWKFDGYQTGEKKPAETPPEQLSGGQTIEGEIKEKTKS